MKSVVRPRPGSRPAPAATPAWLQPLVMAAALLLAAAVPAAQGQTLPQFATVPAPLVTGAPRESTAVDAMAYRTEAARHLYAAYPARVFRGRLPPLLYGVMMVETELDAAGQVVNVQIIRPPAAPEVAPWVVAMIRRAAPFPPPVKLAGAGGTVSVKEIWLVDRSGLFQVDALTEGQR
jgi:TonB family protein